MDTVPEAGARRRTGNRRDEEARRAILHAADDLLAEHGFAKLTIEAIARGAGVAKQTIYRWWPSKVDILLDGLAEGAEKYLSVPEGEITKADVDDYFERYRHFIDELPDGQVLLALLGHAQHDIEAARLLHDRFLTPQRNHERDLIERATRSQGPVHEDVDAYIDGRIGPILWRGLTQPPAG